MSLVSNSSQLATLEGNPDFSSAWC